MSRGRLQIARGLAHPSRNSWFKGRESYRFNSGKSLATENREGASMAKRDCEHTCECPRVSPGPASVSAHSNAAHFSVIWCFHNLLFGELQSRSLERQEGHKPLGRPVPEGVAAGSGGPQSARATATTKRGQRCPFSSTPTLNSGLSAQKGIGSLPASRISTVAARVGTPRRTPTLWPLPLGPPAREAARRGRLFLHSLRARSRAHKPPGQPARDRVCPSFSTPAPGAPLAPEEYHPAAASSRQSALPCRRPCSLALPGTAPSVNTARPALRARTCRWECEVLAGAREAEGGGGRRAVPGAHGRGCPLSAGAGSVLAGPSLR